MKSIVICMALLYFSQSVAQTDLHPLLKRGSKPIIDHKACEVCVRHIGETYDYIAPFTGWSKVPAGTLAYYYEKEKRNPYDNHPYLLYTDKRIPPNSKTDQMYYRIIDGFKYTGEIVDSIANKQNQKEIASKGMYKDGLPDGHFVFYFTSDDLSNEATTKVGEIKSEGSFSNGKMMGEWKYYGYTSPLISKGKYLIEKRTYDESSIFPIKGKYYNLNNAKEAVVVSEYEYKDNVMQFVKQYAIDGHLTSQEILVDFKVIDPSSEDLVKEYDYTSFHPNKTIQAKGKYIGKPFYYKKSGVWRYYNEKGKLTSEMNYVDGEIVGLCKIYYDNGKKQKTELYADGKSTIVDYWNERGKQLVKNGNGKIETKMGNLVKIETVQNGEITTSYEKN